ncbi:hypothetical protein [Pontibacter sp. G13]|uniref:hypothetical protein n=1 Tax=Pontibacter sp. G13 TaxID=3074898 RepID=UPI00288990F0|nr:hypothetical protein [Pontibacter sp. G13]WNJ16810.1 hypothetical protein RJD25_18230 [Pontibacter sp. G13]
MKSLSLLFFLATIGTTTTFAQDWRLLNPQYEYYYSVDSSEVIQHVIFTDSVEVVGMDTVYHLNRIGVQYGSTDDYGSDPRYIVTNQPQFLMRQVSVGSQGIYLFEDTTTFRIESRALPADAWMFSASNNISAVVTDLRTDTIFGMVEEIKEIDLTNGLQIIISKNYGIVEFPGPDGKVFRLQGVGVLEVGQQFPDAHDLFGFEVGDKFIYTEGEWGSGYGSVRLEEFEVMADLTAGDSIAYLMAVRWDVSNYFGNSWGPMWEPSRDTIVWKPAPENLLAANSYPGQMLYFKYLGHAVSIREEDSLGYATVQAKNWMLIDWADTLRGGSAGSAGPAFHYYREGRGMVHFEHDQGLGGIYRIQRGYIHQGDTIGQAFDEIFAQYTSIDPQYAAWNLRVYPNPSPEGLIQFSSTGAPPIAMASPRSYGKGSSTRSSPVPIFRSESHPLSSGYIYVIGIT